MHQGSLGYRGFRAVVLLIAAAVVAAPLLIARDAHVGDSNFVSNKTDEVLTISVYGDEGGLHNLGTVEPGASRLLMGAGELGEHSAATKDGCTFGDLVAVTARGQEVARRKAPLCKGETWVIQAPGPPAS